MRLLRAELLRARSRRATWVIVGGLLLLCLAFVGIQGATNAMPSDAQRQQAEEWAAETLADWEANHQEWYDECVASAEASNEDPDDWGCQYTLERPSADVYLWIPQGFAERVASETSSLVVLAAAAVALLGASLVAAEHATGSLGNWLTFEPRRVRVLLAKLAAPALVAIPVTLLVGLVAIGGTWVWTTLREIPSSEALDTTALVGIVVRATAVAVAAGVLGAALGALLRHTAAVIGVGVGYLIGVEFLFGAALWGSPFQRWLLSTQILAVVDGERSYLVRTCKPDLEQGGRICDEIEKTLTAGQAALSLGGLALVLVVVALLVFRRRDVH